MVIHRIRLVWGNKKILYKYDIFRAKSSEVERSRAKSSEVERLRMMTRDFEREGEWGRAITNDVEREGGRLRTMAKRAPQTASRRDGGGGARHRGEWDNG